MFKKISNQTCLTQIIYKQRVNKFILNERWDNFVSLFSHLAYHSWNINVLLVKIKNVNVFMSHS